MTDSARRRARVGLPLLAMLAVLLVPGGAAAATATPVGPRVDPVHQDSSPSIAVDASGFVHLAYARAGDAPGIYYSTNRAGSWQTERVTSNAADADPEIGVDGLGKAHIAFWHRQGSTNRGVYYATNRTGQWLAHLLAADGAMFYGVSLAVETSGAIHIAWDGAYRGTGIYHLTNRTGTTVATRVAGGYADAPVGLDISASGKAYVVFNGDNTTNPLGIHLASNASGSWTKVQLTSGRTFEPLVAVDGNAKVHVTYRNAGSLSPPSMGLWHLTDRTGAWTETQLTTGADVLHSSAVDGAGRLHTVYNHRASWGENVWLTRETGGDPGTQTTAVTETTDTAQRTQPALTLDAQGFDHVAYVAPGATDVTYATNRSGVWVPMPGPFPLAAAPDVEAPVHLPAVGKSLSSTSATAATAPVTVSWRANVTGIVAYELHRKVDSGSFTAVSVPAGATSVALSLAPSHSYQFRVRGKRSDGTFTPWSTGAASRLGLLQETSTSIVYGGGTWTRASSSSASGGYTKYASRANLHATLTFSGRSVAWVAPRSSTRGKARVYVDGVLRATIDLYSSSAVSRRIVYRMSWPTSDPHTLQIRLEGTSGRPRVDVDAFVVDR